MHHTILIEHAGLLQSYDYGTYLASSGKLRPRENTEEHFQHF